MKKKFSWCYFMEFLHKVPQNSSKLKILSLTPQNSSENCYVWKILLKYPQIYFYSVKNILWHVIWLYIFHCEKGWNKSQRQCTKKYTKKSFIVQIFMSAITLFLLYHFFGIWLTVKFRNFFMIKTLFQILHVFVLLYKDKLKVQHVCCALTCCTFMLHFF